MSEYDNDNKDKSASKTGEYRTLQSNDGSFEIIVDDGASHEGGDNSGESNTTANASASESPSHRKRFMAIGVVAAVILVAGGLLAYSSLSHDVDQTSTSTDDAASDFRPYAGDVVEPSPAPQENPQRQRRRAIVDDPIDTFDEDEQQADLGNDAGPDTAADGRRNQRRERTPSRVQKELDRLYGEGALDKLESGIAVDREERRKQRILERGRRDEIDRDQIRRGLRSSDSVPLRQTVDRIRVGNQVEGRIPRFDDDLETQEDEFVEDEFVDDEYVDDYVEEELYEDEEYVDDIPTVPDHIEDLEEWDELYDEDGNYIGDDEEVIY